MSLFKPVELLLVEDNPFDEELALKALRKHHLANDVVIARDGAEALDFIFGTESVSGALEDPPRVILLDLNLPKIGGLEVLRQLKGDTRTRTIPVVVMTSSAEESDLLDSYQLGANSYVVKPVDFEEYTEVVRVLGRYWLLCNKTAPSAPDNTLQA
ncbi:MAG: response regulator [Candidatus Competibacteraceae bacterium]|nr:response regulator [Candidatus Competibacteraceae bacterium]